MIVCSEWFFRRTNINIILSFYENYFSNLQYLETFHYMLCFFVCGSHYICPACRLYCAGCQWRRSSFEFVSRASKVKFHQQRWHFFLHAYAIIVFPIINICCQEHECNGFVSIRPSVTALISFASFLKCVCQCIFIWNGNFIFIRYVHIKINGLPLLAQDSRVRFC